MEQHDLTLQLQHYRRFVETGVIAFEPGLTIIGGPNGAGKSTLIGAFLYALFGLKSKQSLEDIRTDSLNKEVRVECNLHIDDQEVHIVRSGNIAELRMNNVIQVQGSPGSGKAVTKRVTALLGGLTREQFEHTYVALQGETAGLVAEKASDRRQVIEKVLQLEVLTKAAELQTKRCENAKGGVLLLGKLICDDLSLDTKARSYLQSFQGARTTSSKSQHAQRLLKSIEQVITERQQQQQQQAEDQVAQAEARKADTEKQRQEHELLVNKAQNAYGEQEKCQSAYNQYQERIAGVEGRRAQNKLDVEKCQATIQQSEQYAEASATYLQLQGQTKSDEARLGRIPHIRSCYSTFITNKDRLNELDSQLEKLKHVDEELYQAQEVAEQGRQRWDKLRNNDPTQADNETWLTQKSIVDHEEKQNREALKVLTNGTSDARCPTCNQPFTEHSSEHRLRHLNIWLNETLLRRRAELQQQKQSIDAKKQHWVKETQKAHSDYEQLRKDAVEKEKQVLKRDSLCAERNKVHTNFLKSRQEWLELEEGVSAAQEENPHDRLNEWRKEEENLRNRLSDMRKQASELQAQAGMYARLPEFRQTLTEKQQEQEQLTLDKQELLEQQQQLRYTPEAFQATKDALRKANEELGRIQEQLHKEELALREAKSSVRGAQEGMEKAQSYHNRFGICVREYYREERLREHLEEFKKHFFAANTDEVMRRTTELLMHAITDQSILGVKFEGEELQYLDASYSARPISRLSGGEKALVGLCLRVALAEQAQTIIKIGRVKFLVLDEVLSSLDEERCEAVKRIFEDVLQRGIFEHIVMITHLDTVKQSWNAHGLAIQKDGKTSTVASVSPDEIPMDEAEAIEV